MSPTNVARFLTLVTLFISGAALGADQPPNEVKRREAKEHYVQGAAAYRVGRFHEAVERFLTADRIDPSPALSFNVARAYEKLHEPARALEHYRDYLRRGAGAQHEGAVRARVRELEAALQARGVQQLTIFSIPLGAEVYIDDRPVGTTPRTVELVPGKHRVAVRKEGYVEDRRDFDQPPDRAVDLSIQLSPQPPASTSSPNQVPPAALGRENSAREVSSLGLGPWITLGAGGGALLGAGIFELLRNSAEEDAKATPQVEYDDEYKDRYDRAEAHQTTARVLAGAGAALVVTGGIWAYIDHRQRQKARTDAALSCVPKSCFGSLKVRF